MSTGKSTRRNKGADPPVLPLTTSQSQLSKLPVSTLQLYLNQFHLAQDGNKAAKVQRLYAHLQSLQGTTQTASSGSSQSDSSDHSSDSNSSSQSEYDGPEEDPTVPDQAGRHRSRHSKGNSPASSTAPFSKAQRKALTETIRSVMKEKERKRSRRHRSPTISSPSSSETDAHKSRSSAKTKRSKGYHTSSSSSHSSISSSSSESPSPVRHRHGRHHKTKKSSRHSRHRRTSRRQAHAPPVTRKVRHAIERGEFIELYKLLSRHVGCGNASKRPTSTRSITGLDSWLEAWSIYAAVLSAHRPDVAPDLFQYQAFITRSSTKFQPYAWLQYDAQFRMKMASDPAGSWSSTDSELVATWLSADATKRQATCFSCGSPDHLSAECPLRTSKRSASPCPVCNITGHLARDCPQLVGDKQSKPGTGGDEDRYCRIYNRRGTCFRGSKCPYYHACSGCNGAHPKRACPQAR